MFVKQRFVAFASKEHWEPMQELATLAEQGKLRPLIDRQSALAEVPAAMNDLEAGKVCGKVVIRVA